jgi:YHS domain-containing protein
MTDLPMAHGPIAIDPVCGMEVDTRSSQLSITHEGTVYWFCGRGCLLEFRDDPGTYLDPDHVPSM